jgi:hypothetical protein
MENAYYSPGRREFLRQLGMGSAFMLFALQFGGCEEIIDAIKNRPTRRRITPGSPEAQAMMELYKEAVSQMKGLSAADGRSWVKQASLHGTASAFTFCKHRTSHFVSWHRAYLFYFEKICRKLCGDPTFALPYWNWTLDNKVPANFWDTNSPLYLAGRAATANSEADATMIGPDILEGILSENNFYLFGSGTNTGGTSTGELEGTPHNYIHNFVGGTMGQGNSPLDPVFWTHHCMVDYCWYDWNVNRNHANPSDATWLTTSWNHFFDEEGNPATIEAATTQWMPLLSYQYEETQIGTSASAKIAVGKSEAEVKEIKKKMEKGARIVLASRERMQIQPGLQLVARQPAQLNSMTKLERFSQTLSANGSDRVLLNVGFAKFPTDNTFFVRVYVNEPNATAATGIRDPRFAGSFAFFGKDSGEGGHEGHDGHDHKPAFNIDLTETLQRLQQQGAIQPGEDLQFTFVPVPITPDRPMGGEQLNLEQVDLSITNASVQKL